MALVVLSKVEQRLDAVRAVLAGREVSDFAVVLGVAADGASRQGRCHTGVIVVCGQKNHLRVYRPGGGFPVPSRQRAPHSADASPEQGPRSARPRSGEGERP